MDFLDIVGLKHLQDKIGAWLPAHLFVVGNGNTLVRSEKVTDIIPGHTYRVTLLAWDQTGVTSTSSYDGFSITWGDDNDSRTYLVQVKCGTTPQPSYEVTLPSSGAVYLQISGRLTSGTKGACLVQDITELAGTTIFDISSMNTEEAGKVILANGNSTSYTGATIYSFSAKEGDIIVSRQSLPSSYIAIATKEDGGTSYRRIALGNPGENIFYCCQKDQTIYISFLTGVGNYIGVIRDKKLAAVAQKELTEISGLLTAKKGQYVNFSTGEITTSSTNALTTRTFPADGVGRVRVLTGSPDATGAAIAFYSDTPSSETYISGVQASNSRAGKYSEAEVPANAKYVIVSNHGSYVASPRVWVDNASSILQARFSEFETGETAQYCIIAGSKYVGNSHTYFDGQYASTGYYPLQIQESLRNTSIVGIRIYGRRAGTLSVVKNTDVAVTLNAPTLIKQFTITTGWQTLYFDEPVILGDNEVLGMLKEGDTCRLEATTSLTNYDLKVTYYHTSQLTWTTSEANFLLQVIGIPAFKPANAFAPVAFGLSYSRFNGPFHAHLFLDKIDQTSRNIIVPSESLADIRVAKRLGYNMIEANVQKTSDGEYVVIHGSSGKFGYEVVDLNGEFTYANTSIDSVTLEWIKTNIRYRSDIARYRTSIPTLEEFLMECRIQGMGVVAWANTAKLCDRISAIVGRDNFIAYGGKRQYTSAMISTYTGLSTKEEILAHCRSYGLPFLYCMSNPTDFTDEELADIVGALHKEGYMIGCAASYITNSQLNRCIRLGFDTAASGKQVNEFEGNLVNLSATSDFSEFDTNGIVSDGVLTLEIDQTLSTRPGTFSETPFLSKCGIRIVYEGSLSFVLGNNSAAIVSSDGVNSIWMSSYFFNAKPGFTITANARTIIHDISFRASKC